MKLVRSQYLVLTCAKNQSAWTFCMPGAYLTMNDGERVKICARQIVWRNDFPTVLSSSYISFGPSGGPMTTVYTAKRGSPNIRDLIKDMNSRAISPTGYNAVLPYTISFDRFTSRVTLTSPIAAGFAGNFEMTLDYAFANVLGLTAITYTDGSAVSGFSIAYDLKGNPVSVTIPFSATKPTVIGANDVDLAGPESLFLRMSGLTSTNVEIDSNNRAAVRDLLCVFPNNTPPFSTGNFQDPQSVYAQYISSVESLATFTLTLADSNGTPCVSQNEIVISLSLEIFQDDSEQMLEALQQMNDMQKTQLMAIELSRQKT